MLLLFKALDASVRLSGRSLGFFDLFLQTTNIFHQFMVHLVRLLSLLLECFQDCVDPGVWLGGLWRITIDQGHLRMMFLSPTRSLIRLLD